MAHGTQRLKLAIITTHPIQYYAPVFRALAQSCDIHPRVFYTWSQAASGVVFDEGFKTAVAWDVPLLDGYDHEFVPNVARRAGTERFFGNVNPTLIGSIEKWHPDAVLVYGWRSHSHLQAMRHFHGRRPVFFRGDSTLLDERPSWRRVARKIFLSWIYRHVDAAIAVGQNNRDYYLWCGVSAARIAFAPHSVDVRRFADDDGSHAQRAADWRRELGIGADELVIVYAGKLIAKKDPCLLLDALRATQTPAHLVFFGSGDLESRVRAHAGESARIHFLPFQNQRAMPAVYRVGDCFALPSRGPGETWGLSLNEAMASGCPVIASTKVGGARDLIRDGVNGWVFESGNLAALTDVLSRALALGREGLRDRGKAARSVSEEWSTDRAASRIAAAVSQFTGPRGHL